MISKTTGFFFTLFDFENMDLSGYLGESESPIQTIEAYNGYEDTSGQLALTKSRLVFIKGKNAVDISLDAVDAIEFKEPSIPLTHIAVAIALAVGGVFASEVTSKLDEFPIGQEILVIGGIAGGLLVGGLGLFYRRAHLHIYTPSGDFKFTSRDSTLQKFPSAVRKLR